MTQAYFTLPQFVPPVQGIFSENRVLFPFSSVRLIAQYLDHSADPDGDGYFYTIEDDPQYHLAYGIILATVFCNELENGSVVEKVEMTPQIINGTPYYRIADPTGRYIAGWIEDSWQVYDGNLTVNEMENIHQYSDDEFTVDIERIPNQAGEYNISLIPATDGPMEMITRYSPDEVEEAYNEILRLFPNAS
jgi:hypothetical protein